VPASGKKVCGEEYLNQLMPPEAVCGVALDMALSWRTFERLSLM
jgi:hypothetical protein